MDREIRSLTSMINLKKRMVDKPKYIICSPRIFDRLIGDVRTSFSLNEDIHYKYMGLILKVVPGIQGLEVANEEGVIYDAKFLR